MVFERKGFAREMVSNCNVGATTYTVCWVDTDRGQHRPKAGKKKKTREAGLFFLVLPLSLIVLKKYSEIMNNFAQVLMNASLSSLFGRKTSGEKTRTCTGHVVIR